MQTTNQGKLTVIGQSYELAFHSSHWSDIALQLLGNDLCSFRKLKKPGCGCEFFPLGILEATSKEALSSSEAFL